jgi:hypothetical protein
MAISCLVAGVFLTTCKGFETGPDLSAQITDVELLPTTGNADICCCRVTGSITNTSEVPIHATIKFAAFESDDAVEPFSRILHFMRDLQPGEPQRFLTQNNGGEGASGFLVPCSRIKVLKREVDVNGLWSPPE